MFKGTRPDEQLSAYCASKGGLNMMFKVKKIVTFPISRKTTNENIRTVRIFPGDGPGGGQARGQGQRRRPRGDPDRHDEELLRGKEVLTGIWHKGMENDIEVTISSIFINSYKVKKITTLPK